MSRLSKRTLVAILAVIMTLTATMGMTLAYFSDTDSAEGGAILLLSGKTEIVEPDVTKDSKTIQIKNISEDPVDVVARVKVIAPVDVTWDAESGWVDGGDGWWYYTEVIPQRESTSKLKVEWKIPEDSEIENYDVVVLHESATAVYTESGAVRQPEGWNCPTFEK